MRRHEGDPTPTQHYRWVAHYPDGSSLSEDEQAARHAIGDMVSIGWPDIVAMELVPLIPGLPALALAVPPGARAIHLRRRTITLDSATGRQVPGLTEALGWQATIRGRNVQAYTVVLPDGSILVTGSGEGW